MPRTGRTKPRVTEPDPVYNSQKLSKLINRVMKSGKKTVAQRQVYAALDIVKKEIKKDPELVFENAIKNITPQMEVRSRRVGGATYQVPMPLREPRGFSLAIRWLVTEARKRPNKQHHTFAEKLAAEIVAASRGEGGSIERKLNTHRQADANKAFAHFRW